MNWLDRTNNKQIIEFVIQHKGRCNDIQVTRDKHNGEMIEVATEIWDRWDDRDKEYKYYYGPYGEMEPTPAGYRYIPFNAQTKEWFKMMYELTKSETYAKKFKEIHVQAIIEKGETDLAEIDSQIEQLKLKKSEIAVQGNLALEEMKNFVDAERRHARRANQERDNLLVKAFFEGMTPEERTEWLQENGILEATKTENAESITEESNK